MYTYLASRLGTAAALDRPVREFVTQGRVAPGIDVQALKSALNVGVHETVMGVLLLACAGLAVIATLLVRVHRPLAAPDLRAFDAGEAALATPEPSRARELAGAQRMTPP